MATLPAPITDAELGDLSPSQPVFLSLAAELLTNAATPSDGFDQAFGALVEMVPALEATLGVSDADLVEAAGFAAQVDPHSLDADVLAFAESVPVGDKIIADFEALTITLPAGIEPPAPTGSDATGGTGGRGVITIVPVYNADGTICIIDLDSSGRILSVQCIPGA